MKSQSVLLYYLSAMLLCISGVSYGMWSRTNKLLPPSCTSEVSYGSWSETDMSSPHIRSPFHRAVIANDVGYVAEKFSDSSIGNFTDNGTAALYLAIANNPDTRIARMLLAANADPNQKSRTGISPLCGAMLYSINDDSHSDLELEKIRLLLAYNADDSDNQALRKAIYKYANRQNETNATIIRLLIAGDFTNKKVAAIEYVKEGYLLFDDAQKNIVTDYINSLGKE